MPERNFKVLIERVKKNFLAGVLTYLSRALATVTHSVAVPESRLARFTINVNSDTPPVKRYHYKEKAS
jgi:hypothetical protein